MVYDRLLSLNENGGYKSKMASFAVFSLAPLVLFLQKPQEQHKKVKSLC